MACTTCQSEASASARESGETLKQVFTRFWPAHLPFPPIAPYLAASVSRGEAYAWLLDLGASNPGVLSGDPMAVLDFIGRSLNDVDVYAAKRKKKKRKGGKRPPDTPVCPTTYTQYNNTCGFMQTVTVHCDLSVTFDPECPYDVTGGHGDIASDEGLGGP